MEVKNRSPGWRVGWVFFWEKGDGSQRFQTPGGGRLNRQPCQFFGGDILEFLKLGEGRGGGGGGEGEGEDVKDFPESLLKETERGHDEHYVENIHKVQPNKGIFCFWNVEEQNFLYCA